MTVQIVLTEEMIDCFHSCAKKADYQQLFNDYSWFFDELVENLEKVQFRVYFFDLFGERICQLITKNSKHLLDILRKWHSSEFSLCKELLDIEERYPIFIQLFRESGSVKDWNNFYAEYNFIANKIIKRARNERILDFKIECAGMIFDSFEKRDKFLEHGRKLRNELMELFDSQAQQIEKQISEANEKMSQTIKKLELKEQKLEEDGKKLRNELMESIANLERHVENRISETNEKIESINRKLAHFNSSFNEKFNSLEEKLSSIQLDKKIEALSVPKNSGEDLNQFLTKIENKFNEQQSKMEMRADWLEMKMKSLLEMMVQNTATVSLASPGTATFQDNTTDTSQNFPTPDASVIEPSVIQTDPTDSMKQSPEQAMTANEQTSEEDELQQMEEQFQRAKAEQDRVYGEKLRIAQEKRREMNEREAEERRRISENLQRAASFRRSFH